MQCEYSEYMENDKLSMDINQFLTKEVLGECWHEWTTYCVLHETDNCGCIIPHCRLCDKMKGFNASNRDFSTPADCLYLLRECSKKRWWDKFLKSSEIIIDKMYGCDPIYGITINALLDLKQIGEAIARFRGWEEV